MAKPPSSVIGIDLSDYSLKAVHLVRQRGGRTLLSHFATRELGSEEPLDADALTAHLRALLHTLGAKAKGYALSLSGSGTFVRIIGQPETPPVVLREALRLNGSALLNQDCREMVLDCDIVPSSYVSQGQRQYLVGGAAKSRVAALEKASQKLRLPTTLLQLAPVALFNAFEFGEPATFSSQAFVLVDIGHFSTNVIVGVSGELVMVRTLDFGGKRFLEELICHGASSYEEVFAYLAEEEVLTVENARLSLTELVRSITASIGYVEAQRDAVIPRVFVSGGMARSATILKILTEELQLPCDVWNPFAQCEIGLSASRREELAGALPLLGVACGCAVELLNGI